MSKKKILALVGIIPTFLTSSCQRYDIKYLCLQDFVRKMEGVARPLGAIKINNLTDEFGQGYMIISRSNNGEEYYLYFDETFLTNKFSGPYKFESYNYSFSIDEICDFIVENSGAHSGFDVINDLTYSFIESSLSNEEKAKTGIGYFNIIDSTDHLYKYIVEENGELKIERDIYSYVGIL